MLVAIHDRRRSFNGAAARWPRRCVCALLGSESGHGASMGPRLGGRGDDSNARVVAIAEYLLQWGRGSVAAEIGVANWRATVSDGTLQWGRGSVAAEMKSARMRAARTSMCFNGAAARWPRRLPRLPVAFLPPVVELQWGRGSVAAEIVDARPMPNSSAVCFNGAAARWPRR